MFDVLFAKRWMMDGGVGARAEGSVGWQVAAQAQLRSARLYTQRRTPLIINSPRKYLPLSTLSTLYNRIHILLTLRLLNTSLTFIRMQYCAF